MLDPEQRILMRVIERPHMDDYREWVDANPGVELIVAHKCGHNIQLDNPALVIAAIQEVAVARNPAKSSSSFLGREVGKKARFPHGGSTSSTNTAATMQRLLPTEATSITPVLWPRPQVATRLHILEGEKACR